MSSPEDELVKRAATLARSAPKDWDQFVGALAVYTNLQTTHCIQSPLEELPRNQGRAQNAARLYGLLADCLAKADAIEGRRK